MQARAEPEFLSGYILVVPCSDSGSDFGESLVIREFIRQLSVFLQMRKCISCNFLQFLAR